MDGLTLRRKAVFDPLRRQLARYGIQSAYADDDTLSVSVCFEEHYCNLISDISVRLQSDRVHIGWERGNDVLLADPELESKLLAAVLKSRELQFNAAMRDGICKYSVSTFVERIDDSPVRCFTTTSPYHKTIIFEFLRERAKPWLPRNLHPNIERIVYPLIDCGAKVSCFHLFPWDLYTVDYSQPVELGTTYRYRSNLWSYLGDDFATSLFRLIGTTRRIVMWRIDH